MSLSATNHHKPKSDLPVHKSTTTITESVPSDKYALPDIKESDVEPQPTKAEPVREEPTNSENFLSDNNLALPNSKEIVVKPKPSKTKPVCEPTITAYASSDNKLTWAQSSHPPRRQRSKKQQMTTGQCVQCFLASRSFRPRYLAPLISAAPGRRIPTNDTSFEQRSLSLSLFAKQSHCTSMTCSRSTS